MKPPSHLILAASLVAVGVALAGCGPPAPRPARGVWRPPPVAALPAAPADEAPDPCEPDPEPHTTLLPRCIETDRGRMSVEGEYIPGVVECEVGGVTQEAAALEAQAVAARTYLVRFLRRRGEDAVVPVGPRFQCWRKPRRAGSVAAAARTADLVMHYEGQPIAANYVSGTRALDEDCLALPPSESGYAYKSWDAVRKAYLTARKKKRKRPFSGTGWTEAVVTRNAGRSGEAVNGTPMASVGTHNRGAMAQWAATCLAGQGADTMAVLRHFYGDDVVISSELGAHGEHDALPDLYIPGVTASPSPTDATREEDLPARPEGDRPES